MNTIQIEDLADIGRLLGTDSELLEMTSEFSPSVSVPAQRALRVRKGLAVVRGGAILPVLEGQTCTQAFRDVAPAPGGLISAASSVPRARLKNVMLLTGSINTLPFLSYYFPALLFAKHVAGSKVTVHSAQAWPASMASLIEDLLPIFAGGRPAEIAPLEDGTYDVEDCVFPIIRTKDFLPAVCARRIILPFVLSRMEAVPRDTVKIFLRDAERPLANEEQLAAWFVARGYLAVDVSTLSFAEQVVLFARATHIVSSENAALVNLAFAVQARTIVILRSDSAVLNPLLGFFVEDFDATLVFVDGEGPSGLRIPLERLETLDPAVL